jgi:lipocalin
MDLLLAMHMTVFDPYKYSGAWYETMSIKKGFAGLGQADCMDTRGLYEYNPDRDELDVQTGCRHLDGHVSGIKGVVTCPTRNSLPFVFSKRPKPVATCSLRFPTAPFVPPANYSILETDYESYAIVESGLGPKSGAPFVQVYSRYSRPGLRFIVAKKELLRKWGYDPDEAHVTPVTIDGEPRVKVT